MKYIKRRKNMKKDKPNRGAPHKRETIENNGLRRDQNERLKSIAMERDVPIKVIVREAIEWYLDALEMGRKAPIINQQFETADRREVTIE